MPKTEFMSKCGYYYYKVIPLGLKNVGATNQWLMNVVFSHQVERNLEIYVDDMIVKST